LNYYPFHIGDYASATRHLSWDEDAAYRRLLDAYYLREGPLPLELRALYRLVSAQSDAQREAVETVLREFFKETPDGWTHGRCDIELAAMRDKREKAAQSAKAKWAKANARAGDANAGKPDANADSNSGRRSATNTNTNTNTNSSVPNGTGAVAPPTDRDLVFANGVTLLTAAGVSDKNARSFLAAQCKAHGEAAVRRAIDQCAAARPIQPVPWLQSVLGARPPPSKPERIAAGNIDVVQRFAQRQA
jgi:uncharacterized protein YdaU (DUF1376 family)